MPGHTTKIHPKAVCLVEQAEHHNLPQGIIVNRCVAKVKSRFMTVILIKTTKQNVWLWQPLLAAELYNAEYHPIEHWADKEVKGDVVNISFLPVVPNTIRVQVEQVESTPTDISTPNPNEKPVFGPRQDSQSEVFLLHDEDLRFCDRIKHTILMTTDKPVYLPHCTIPA